MTRSIYIHIASGLTIILLATLLVLTTIQIGYLETQNTITRQALINAQQ